MTGRCGADDLYYFICTLWMVLLLFDLFIGSYIILGFVVLLMVLANLRYFSKNLLKRRDENDRYRKIVYQIREWFRYQKDRIKDIRKKRYRRCPGCKVALRLPIKKGKHTVECPRCGKEFKVNILF